MTCLTPDLTSFSGVIEWPVVASVSFIMDAVDGLVTGSVSYFEDPVVYQFDGVQYFNDDDVDLEIKVCRLVYMI